MRLNAAQVVWFFTLAFTLSAGWLDWRARRIPNWLTVPGLLAGIVIHSIINGWHGAAIALEGAGLALMILLPLVLMRALGAGDWKLMGAVGALLGPWMLVFVLVASIFVVGFMAVVSVFQAKRALETLHNIAALIRGFFVFGLRAHPEISLDNPGLLKLPFGVAAAIGTLICFVAAEWHLAS
jgi:prepilin peptidase CpaA